MIRVMVVDDEPLAREDLAGLIEKDPGFKVVEQAGGGREALQKLEQSGIDVLFLDIEMPRVNGLEVAAHLAESDNPPLVVFATAYHQYALEAFEANAVDYILKPYEPERLAKTLERIRERIEKGEKESPEHLKALNETLTGQRPVPKLAGRRKQSKDKILIDALDVYYFHVHYSEVLARVENEELIVNATLKELLESLPEEKFAQTHKSYIVNIDKVAKVSPMFSGNYELALKKADLPKVPLSRRYAKNLKARLGGW